MHPRALSTVTFPVRVVLCNVTRWEHPLIITQKQSPVERIKKKKKNQTETCLEKFPPSCRGSATPTVRVPLYKFCLLISEENPVLGVNDAGTSSGCTAPVPVGRGATAFPKRSTARPCGWGGFSESCQGRGALAPAAAPHALSHHSRRTF